MLGIPLWGWIFLYGSVVGFGVLIDRVLWTIVAVFTAMLFISLFDTRSQAEVDVSVAHIRHEMHRDIGQEALDARDRFIRENR